MNVGVDIGNITSIAIGDREVIIESIVEEYEQEDNLRPENVFSFDGNRYTLNKGDFENNLLKYKKRNFLKLLFYTLYKCTDDCVNNIVIGIPAKQYKSERRLKEFYEFLDENRIHTINDRTIILNKIEIVPEGYGVRVQGYLNNYDEYEDLLENVPTLVIDIGGETTDLILFDENQRFITAENVKEGLLKIYEAARSFINDTYTMNINKASAKKYFDGDRDLRKDPELGIEDVNAYKKDIVITVLRKILNDINNHFENMRQYNIILCGGGAEIVGDVFKQIYSQTIIIPEITVNAQGNKDFADLKWEDENENIELEDKVIEKLDHIWKSRYEEKSKAMLFNIWNNNQGKEILKDLYDVNGIEDINRINLKKYTKKII